MSEQKKSHDAEDILSEFQGHQTAKEESSNSDKIKPLESEIISSDDHNSNETEIESVSPPLENKDDSETTELNPHERNVIYVGTKPIMTYVTATLTQLASQPTVTIKARGKRITQAVDVSQMIVKRMNTVGYTISGVRISADSLTSQDGKQRNVSTMEIDITKP